MATISICNCCQFLPDNIPILRVYSNNNGYPNVTLKLRLLSLFLTRPATKTQVISNAVQRQFLHIRT
jgi:hypothetical protein